MRSYDTPIDLLGETLLTGWSKVDEFRLVQAFFATHARPGEPTVALPFIPLYNVLLDRPSPLRFVADHPQGNFVMTIPQKRVEAERLLASSARYALGEQYWFSTSQPEDPFRDLLATQFHPVRAYRSVVIFERGADGDTGELVAILRRMTLGTSTAADLDSLRALSSSHPDEPLVWKLRGSLAAGTGSVEEAIDSLHRAHALDPADAAPLERTAALLLQEGRTEDAATDLERARSLRDSPVLRDLAARLATRTD
jgi:tetratricopeptide (TPR) repeat protein